MSRAVQCLIKLALKKDYSRKFFSSLYHYYPLSHGRETTKSFRYLLMFSTGIVGYEIFKDVKIWPAVEAANIIENVHGNRARYNFIADVVETTAPAVVYIEIQDPRRLDFFTGKPVTITNGSGFIIQSDGLILTNAHVVTSKPNVKVEVRLFDGRTFMGVVEDIDMQSDLAMVRIQAKNLPVLRLGNSDQLKPGEFVVAIGSPLALSNTVTSGVVSSTHRHSAELGLHNKDMDYIQTDAAITFGNSGGPLVNLDGEAIGVNSMKVTAGISFAIPIDYVKQFLASSAGKKKGGVKTGGKKRYMGITMLTLTPQIIQEMHQRNHQIPYNVQHGVLVWKVILGSPAHTSGIQPGDIVVSINKRPVQSAKDVYECVANEKDCTLEMTVIRMGKEVKIKVTPEELS